MARNVVWFFFSLVHVKLSQEQTVLCKQYAICTLVMIKVVKRLSGSQGRKGQEKKRDSNKVNSVRIKEGHTNVRVYVATYAFLYSLKLSKGCIIGKAG